MGQSSFTHTVADLDTFVIGGTDIKNKKIRALLHNLL